MIDPLLVRQMYHTKKHMKNKHQDIEIPEQDPFKYDRLERQSHAENFESIVSLYEETGCVIALDGLWGTGKTTFVRMMLQDMRNKGFKPLYYNAWETDYMTDPLAAILGEMHEVLPNNEKWNDLLSTGGKIALNIGSGVLKSVLKNKLGVDTDAIVEEVADTLKEQIDGYTNQKQSFKDFKKALIDYVVDNTSEGRPVVFFIDELDRCNPRYAVQVLERVKHLFDIPNMVFVLIINKQQLQHAICGYFGTANMDAENYLRRFFDIEYQLPDVDKEEYCKILYQEYSLGSLIQSPERKSHYDLQHEANIFWELMLSLVQYSDFDLRTIDKIFAQTSLVLHTYNNSEFIFPNTFLLLIYIRYFNYSLYQQIRDNKLTLAEFVLNLDNCLYPLVQKQIKMSPYLEDIFLGSAAVLISNYAPRKIDDTFYLILGQQKTKYIDCQKLSEFIKEYRSHGRYYNIELKKVFQHLDLLDNVKIHNGDG